MQNNKSKRMKMQEDKEHKDDKIIINEYLYNNSEIGKQMLLNEQEQLLNKQLLNNLTCKINERDTKVKHVYPVHAAHIVSAENETVKEFISLEEFNLIQEQKHRESLEKEKLAVQKREQLNKEYREKYEADKERFYKQFKADNTNNTDKMDVLDTKDQLHVIISNLKNEISTGIYNTHRYKSFDGTKYKCVCCGFSDIGYATGCIALS